MNAVTYRRLGALVDKYRSSPSGSKVRWVKELFEALNWAEDATFDISRNGDSFQLLVDRYPMVNVVVESPTNVDAVYRALNTAYNQDVPWVVATNFKEFGLFGSYWYSFPHDVSSAQTLYFQYNDYVPEAHRLDLLTPYEVSRNALGDLYQSYEFGGRKKRLPIDVHLVERMAKWRQLALEAVQTDNMDSDEIIYRLINTLFLIRFLEDIGRTNGLRLADIAVAEDPSVFRGRLWEMIASVAEKHGYATVSPEDFNALKDAPLKQLIHQLYGYPGWGVEYDFSSMNVDVLGRFYEEYLRSDATPVAEEPTSLELWPQRPFELTEVRRQRGIYYTPRYIVDYILKNVISRFSASNRPNAIPTIVDLACGSGTFLTAAVDQLEAFYSSSKDPKRSYADCLVGFDIDPRAIEATRLNLTRRSISRDVIDIHTPMRLQVVDVLMGGINQSTIKEVLPNGADIIVGNPPYIPYEKLRLRYDLPSLANYFVTSKGKVDSYILFIEAAVRLLKEGGLLGLIVSNSLLYTSNAAVLRGWLTANADILEIVDFQDQRVFPTVGAYTCLLILQKKRGADRPPQVTVGKVYDLSLTPASQLARISVATEDVTGGIEVFTMEQPQGSSRWDLRSPNEAGLRKLIEDSAAESAGEVLELRQGIKTGADDVFVVEGSMATGKNVIVRAKQDNIQIERGILLPAFRNRELRRWSVYSRSYIIYPYDIRTDRVLTWEEICKRFPKAAAYLELNRSSLEKRRSLRGKPWYSLVEPRTATIKSNQPRLLASEVSLRPLVCSPTPDNAVVVGSVWLLLNKKEFDSDSLMAYLNSSVAEWYLRLDTKQLPGGYLLLRQSNLSTLPVPRFLKDEDSFARSELRRLTQSIRATLSDSARSESEHLRLQVEKMEREIDRLIIQELRLTASHVEQIRLKVAISRRASIHG